MAAANCCHTNTIAQAPVRKLTIIKPVQGIPGCTQLSHELEVGSKGKKGVSEGNEGSRPAADAGKDAGLEHGVLELGVTGAAGHAQLASPLCHLPPAENPHPRPVSKLVCHGAITGCQPVSPRGGWELRLH